MNTRAHIAQLIGHMHGLKPNQASPYFSLALVSELIGIYENNQAGITCRKSHTLIVFRSIQVVSSCAQIAQLLG